MGRKLRDTRMLIDRLRHRHGQRGTDLAILRYRDGREYCAFCSCVDYDSNETFRKATKTDCKAAGRRLCGPNPDLPGKPKMWPRAFRVGEGEGRLVVPIRE